MRTVTHKDGRTGNVFLEEEDRFWVWFSGKSQETNEIWSKSDVQKGPIPSEVLDGEAA